MDNNSLEKTTKAPYPFWSILASSLLFGSIGGLLIAHFNNKRMSNDKKVFKIILSGGILLIVLYILRALTLSYDEVAAGYFLKAIQSYRLFVPSCFEGLYAKKWRQTNYQIVEKFQLSVFGWGVVGMFTEFFIAYIIAFVIGVIK